MIVLSCFVFAIVMVMFGYAIWKYRAKPGDESDGEPIHGNTKLEIAWTVIPTIIVLFGAGYSWIVLDDIEAKDADADAGRRDRQQFKWTLRVPRESRQGDGAPLSTNELHVPVDRQLEVDADRARRPALVLGAGVGDQARHSCPAGRRRRRHRQRSSSSPRTRRAPTASSAPSSAGSGTRRCGRRSWSSPRRSSTPGWRAAGGAGGRSAAAERRSAAQ